MLRSVADAAIHAELPDADRRRIKREIHRLSTVSR